MSEDCTNTPEPLDEADTGVESTGVNKPCCTSDGSCDRREALTTGSTVLMAGGLLGGYGTFFAMAGQYFFPSESNDAWMFVGAAKSIEPGSSVAFKSPTGVEVVITRREDKSSDETSKPKPKDDVGIDSVSADSFLALSSVCPHLGCRVHWEGQNNRFFCPCHNGIFDPDGKATGGPPASAGQNLPEYPLKVVDGGLYIEMPFRGV